MHMSKSAAAAGMPLRRRKVAAAAFTLASFALLSGCAAQQSSFTDLQGSRESQDELPQLADYAYDDVDESTSRFIAEHEGTSLWLAAGLEDSTVCLVADAGAEAWVVTCGAGAFNSSGVTGTFEVAPDGATAPEGSMQISENVHAW